MATKKTTRKKIVRKKPAKRKVARKTTKKVAKKKVTKKKARKATKKKVVKKKATPKTVKHEIVVRVQGEPTAKLEDLLPEKGKDNKYSLVKTSVEEKQVLHMLQKTPTIHVHKRKGRAGLMFEYVTGTYMKKVLNYVFGWNWDFEIVSEKEIGKQIVVRGRLTVKDNKGNKIVKEQYGGADIKYKDSKPMDIGNDYKAAATDALKKCASELGIASDIYGKNEFKDIGRPVEETAEKVIQTEAPKNGYACEGYKKKDGCPGNIILTAIQAKYSQKLYKKHLCSTCQNSVKK